MFGADIDPRNFERRISYILSLIIAIISCHHVPLFYVISIYMIIKNIYFDYCFLRLTLL